MKLLSRLMLMYSLLISLHAAAQDRDQRVIMITTDGMRWQEVFKGMDSAIAVQTRYNQKDSGGIFKRYWEQTAEGRRQRLMPFFWGTLAKQGQIYGNRTMGNKVDNANPYKFSYPGYSELLTGHVDTLINSNEYPPNPHVNLFEYINSLPNYRGRVAAFAAWGAFDRILNETRSGFPVINAFDDNSKALVSPQMDLLNRMVRSTYKPFGNEEVLDVFTHFQALTYLQTKRPKAMYIGYGDTDEFAHHAEYKYYLDAAHQFDEWVGEIWNWIQSDPEYKGRTTLLITTDHGRGDLRKDQWTSHGQSVPDAHEMWFAVIGPGVKPLGEIRSEQQWYQRQLAQTLANLAGLKFTANHQVTEGVPIPRR